MHTTYRLQNKNGTILVKSTDDIFELMLGGKPVLRLDKSGDIHVKNRVVENNISVVYAFREFLKNLERGNLVEHTE